MDETLRRQIDAIMDGMDCPKGFVCSANGFERLCKARDIDLDDHLVCLDENPRQCPFAVPYGGVNFCRCPLRVFVERNLVE